jgi:5-methylcytosine-specific restriction endonuclease McrA
MTTTKIKKQKYINDFKLKDGCCQCGYKDHFAALDLDHIDPTTKNKSLTRSKDGKRRSIGFFSLSWPDLKTEITKCQVLCKICHSIKTYEERQAAIASKKA